ncbi:putative C6 finger domain protein [Aspergillus steynii IBT 23096]|uniref:Transcriptional activator of proteases prtT n=1 Tax=Aspergillus steynii IBT 23096 TaxID=1392250 RepID=A0A2I2GK45_9EURO|nr:putative C6 finger domain protein [Aspergillus steynii IBT 23096]PLB53258.1 putative C6 finger domain protein [Aspergillus steynii IBT 23096]
MPTISPASSAADRRTNFRNSAVTGIERRNQKQRSQRATLACERCRIKKLRCTGGHPCNSCERAGSDCDFGDRVNSDLSISITNQRIAQLEKTVAELVANSRSQGHSRQSSTAVQLESHPPPDDSSFGQSQTLSNPLNESPSPQYHGHEPEKGGPVLPMDTPQSFARTAAAFSDSYTAPSEATPLSQSQWHAAPPSERTHGPASTLVGPEGLQSRWATVQHNAAPFPPLMAYPSTWSREPAKPDGDTLGQSSPGMTHFTAQVNVRSEPIGNGIISEQLARSLFHFFCQKCHPLFPVLGLSENIDGDFDRIRSTASFLFTVILTIASCYYNNYQKTNLETAMVPIAQDIIDALADLSCAHLGFVIFRKQHQLSDVQATLLLSVWIPRGHGQSADQWMVTGICTRLAYRIGVPDSYSRPAISTFKNASHFTSNDIREVNEILSQWHTWLMINHYDTSLSLGFGRPHVSVYKNDAREYLKLVRKLGRSCVIDSRVASYVASMTELSEVSAELISGLHMAQLPTAPSREPAPPSNTVWSRVSALLSDLNPRLDEWQRQWTWNGSYGTISLGNYLVLCKIYGEHTRLCLNSLSLNLLASHEIDGTRELQVTLSSLTRACESAITLVQYFVESGRMESPIRYGPHYLLLILSQSAVFLIRILVARMEQPLPMDRLVLEHYLQSAIGLLDQNNFSTTGICSTLAETIRALARHAGAPLNTESDPGEANPARMDPSFSELEWDFGIPFAVGPNGSDADFGLNLGNYFDFAQLQYPASPGPRQF